MKLSPGLADSTPRTYPSPGPHDADWTHLCIGNWTRAPGHSPVRLASAKRSWVPEACSKRGRGAWFHSTAAVADRDRPEAGAITTHLVLEANQVLLWSVLESAGAPVTVRGLGMLFDDRQPDGNKTEER